MEGKVKTGEAGRRRLLIEGDHDEDEKNFHVVE